MTNYGLLAFCFFVVRVGTLNDLGLIYRTYMSQLRITYSCVVDSFQPVYHHLFCNGYVAEGYRTFNKRSAAYLRVDNVVYQLAYSLFSIFLERA